ncbi:uncharacterized protein LOC119740498 [Patiria miniata]|uniref:Fucolectin tachylectin-4 pentraxin-1 domain-containing protein n=1 Tax=Patiria miniata TaxID=46514 RepID=A0A914B8J8_PATMI|nr:uncharacterized protein LOC119740498 [Patiria miniata]
MAGVVVFALQLLLAGCILMKPCRADASQTSVTRYRRGTISGRTCIVSGKTYQAGNPVPDLSPCKTQCRCFASLFGRTGHVVCAVNKQCTYTNLCVNPITDTCGCPKCRPGGWIWPPVTESVLLSKNRIAWQISTQTYRGKSRGANLAVDGKTDGNFFRGNTCTHTANQYQPWWKLDLGNSFVVTKVVIFNRAGRFGRRLIGAEVRVGGSTVAARNRRCGGPVTKSEAKAGTKITRECPADTRGRFVSVQIRKRKEFLTLCEVKVFGHERLGSDGGVIPFEGYPALPSPLISSPGYPLGFIPGSPVTGGNCIVPSPQDRFSYLIIPDGGDTLLGGCAKCRCTSVTWYSAPAKVVDRGCDCDYSGCCQYQKKHYAPGVVVPNYDGDQCRRTCRCISRANGERPVIACSANSNVCEFESRCVHYEVDKCGCPYCKKGVSDCWGYDPWKQKDVCVPDGHGPVVINPQHPDYTCQCMYVTTIKVNANTVIPQNKLRRARCTGPVH